LYDITVNRSTTTEIWLWIQNVPYVNVICHHYRTAAALQFHLVDILPLLLHSQHVIRTACR